MANTSRRYLNKNGDQFIPMNVEGQNYNDKFLTTPKVITIVTIIATAVILGMNLSSSYATVQKWLLLYGIWFVAQLYAMRYIVFEEKFYFEMYKERKGNEVVTPAKFWNITTIKDSEDGAIMTFADAKIAIVLKLIRGTITGKDSDFKETHYDALSDFYGTVLSSGYNIIHMDLMEGDGKDPRLASLDSLVSNCSNSKVKELVGLQIGEIKNIAQNSLFITDYYMIWTNDITRIDNIINDMIECTFILLDGAFASYEILSKKDLIDLDKNAMFKVKYFNASEASLGVYNHDRLGRTKPLDIIGVVWNDGTKYEFSNEEKNKVINLTSKAIENDQEELDKSLKETLNLYKVNRNVGVDFNRLSKNGTRKVVRPTQKQQTTQKNVQNTQPSVFGLIDEDDDRE